jgi:hypothetical protein
LWSHQPVVRMTGGPKVFTSFAEFSKEVLKASVRPTSSGVDSSVTLELSLGKKTLSASPLLEHCCPLRLDQSPDSSMAYHRVDPTPFLPQGFVAEHIQHREIMVRTVTRIQPSVHEDWGIVRIQPLPDQALNFANIADLVRDYLVEHLRLNVRDIQRLHLGQALVRFRNVFDMVIWSAWVHKKLWGLLSRLFNIMKPGIVGHSISIETDGLCYWGFPLITGRKNIFRMPLGPLVEL